MVRNVLFVLAVLSLSWTPAYQQMNSTAERDISTIEANTNFCVSDTDIPTDLEVVNTTSTSAFVSWTLSSPNSNVSGYEILYRPTSTSIYEQVTVPLDDDTLVNLENLRSFTEYQVYIRVLCQPGVGKLSQPTNFTTESDRPSAAVTNLNVTVNFNNIPNLVFIGWDHIPDDAWNGKIGQYLIYIYNLPNNSVQSQTIPVNYPRNEHFEIFKDGEYGVAVYAVNRQHNQSNVAAQTMFTVNSGGSSVPLDYPFAYILVPGIIFLVIIIVVTVVMFKKIHESRRRNITYCKDIANHRGFVNAIPLHERRSPSSSMSPSGVISPPATAVAHQASFANRPLPQSPTTANGPSPTRQPRQQEPPHFGNGMTTSSYPPAPKMPHPGPLPQLSETSEASFVQMHRTMTNQSEASVFSPTGSSIPPFHSHQQRQRAQTVGVGEGIPSPYEIPEHNGSTLSRAESSQIFRPSSASAAQHRAVAHRGGMGNFPPPPAHSPPPLTHSSMELRARMDSGEGMITSPHGQHTLPRSVSSTHHNAGAKTTPGAMKAIRSEGQFPIFEPEKVDQEKMVYIHPPLDSSMETSIHSMSSFGQNGVGRRPSLETPHYPYQGGLATNGSVVESEAFSSFSERTDPSLPPGIPRAPAHKPTHHDRDRSIRSQGRESLFSETSIELSVSSNSDRDGSPGWDHRGAKSDVGVGILHEPSHSPEDRETVSEVGTGYKQQHPHHVFKQHPHVPPQHTSYQSPASILSSTITSNHV